MQLWKLKHTAVGFFLIIVFSLNSSFALPSTDNTEIKNIQSEPNPQLIPPKIAAFFAGLKPIFTLTAGASISQLGKSESFAPIDLCSYHYIPQSSNSTNMLWGGFLGSEVKRFSSWAVIAGIGYYQPSSLSAKGTLTQGADIASDDSYNYSYSVKSQQVLAEGKLVWIIKEQFQPYLSLGIGPAFNKTYDYQTSVPSSFEFTPIFSSHSQTTFSYAVGAGIDLALAKTFHLGFGYRFTDLGKANLGSGQINTIPISNTLKQSNLYANQIFTQLTFIPWGN